MLRKGYSQKSKRPKVAFKVSKPVAAAAAAAAVARAAEFKFSDQNFTLSVDTTGSTQLCDGLAAGTGVSDRQGREVILKSIQINAKAFATATTGTSQLARLLLVYDRQCNAAAPTLTQVLTAANTVAPRNLDNRHRFKILMDTVVCLPNRVTATESGPLLVPIRFYRKLRHPVEYNAVGDATITSINTGSLYLMSIGDNAGGATAGQISGTVRIRYWDV